MSKASKQIVEEWNQIKTLNPYLLASRNRRFLEGKSRLTARMDDYVVSFIGWCLFLLVLLLILIFLEISSIFRLIGGLGLVFIFFISVKFFRKHYEPAREFALKGRLLVGSIEEFLHTGQGADFLDHAYYKVIYSFTAPDGTLVKGEGKGEYSERALLPVGQPVVVLYVRADKFMAL